MAACVQAVPRNGPFLKQLHAEQERLKGPAKLIEEWAAGDPTGVGLVEWRVGQLIT